MYHQVAVPEHRIQVLGSTGPHGCETVEIRIPQHSPGGQQALQRVRSRPIVVIQQPDELTRRPRRLLQASPKPTCGTEVALEAHDQ
jgi:hypothetical protein